MNEGAVQPFHVIAVWRQQQYFIAHNGQWQKQDGTERDSQCEGADP